MPEAAFRQRQERKLQLYSFQGVLERALASVSPEPEPSTRDIPTYFPRGFICTTSMALTLFSVQSEFMTCKDSESGAHANGLGIATVVI